MIVSEFEVYVTWYPLKGLKKRFEIVKVIYSEYLRQRMLTV